LIQQPFTDWKIIEAVSGDASSRQYFRVEKDGNTAILMDCSAEEDNKVADFVKIGSWLNEIGLHAPKIYESDTDNGFLLIRDFGDVSFRKAIESGGDRLLYYVLATDVLKHLKATSCAIKLPTYNSSNIHKGHRRVIDWYAPTIKKTKNPDGVAEEYLKVWKSIEDALPPCPQGFVHGDFHLENLMVLPDGEGLGHCGIIDFQDAMKGPLPYDLANLLEDARIDVPEDIRAAMKAYYCMDMVPEDVAAFESWYRVLATQFHCRIAGWCIVKALVDKKPRYMAFLPRIENYIRDALKDPQLKPLKAFFSDIKLDFNGANGIKAALSMEYIRTDAF
jgi:aminoglycoside/choline kinase family phosphotransferase